MNDEIDSNIDKDTGLKFNPYEGVALPIQKQVSQVGIPVTPSEELSGIPQASGEAPYIAAGTPQTFNSQKKEQSPGYISTILHETWKMSIPRTAWNIGSSVYRDLADHTEVPEGWSPYDNESYFRQLPEKYHGALLDSSSPARQQQIYEAALEEMKDDAYWSQGPLAAKLVGGISGFVMSGAPFIKIAAFAKKATMAETALVNMQNALPGLAGQAIESAVVEELGNVGTNEKEIATKAIYGLAIGGLLHGAHITYAEAKHNKNLNDAIDVLDGASKGIDVHPIINEKGDVTGYKAVPNGERSVGAAEVKEYQDFVNSKINESLLMKSKPMKALFGNRAFGSAIYRMKTSRFSVAARCLELMVKNRSLTVGEEQGIASNISAYEYHMDLVNKGYRVSDKLNSLYYKTIGLSEKTSFKNKARENSQAGKEKFITRGQFTKDIHDAVEGNIESTRAEVNEAATFLREFFDNTNKTLGKAMGLKDVAFINKHNYLSYLPRQFNINAIALDSIMAAKGESKLLNAMIEELTAQDAQLRNLRQRHDAHMAEIQQKESALLEHLKSKMRDDEYFRDRALTGDATEHLEAKPDRAFKEETKALKHEIEELKKSIGEIEKKKKAFWDDVLSDPANEHLLSEDESTTGESRELAAKWLSDYSSLETLVSTLEKRSVSEVKSAKKKASRAEQKIYEQETSQGRNKAQEAYREKEYAANWIEKELDKHLTEARENLRTEYDRLESLARSGEMPRAFYRLGKNNRIEFINPHRTPELMEPFGSPEEISAYAQQRIERILNMTEEQVEHNLFGNGSPSENSNFLKRRDRTFSYKVYNDGGFLADIGETVLKYSDFVGRRIGIMESFKNSAILQGPEDIASALLKQYQIQKSELSNIKDAAKREREFNKLKKDYEGTQKDINYIYNAYMGVGGGGRFGSNAARAFAMYATAAFMGGLPIALLTDIGVQVMKHGIGGYLADGLLPSIKTINGHLKGANSESIREYAADAGVAMSSLKARVMMSQVDVLGNSTQHLGGMPSRMLSFASNAIGQFSLANYIQDMFHMQTSFMAQSRIMRNMHKYLKDGKLNKRETGYMASLGIDVEANAKRFVEQFKQYGRKEGKNGYFSEHTKWDDLEAYEAMRKAIYRDVMSVHFEGTRFDSPVWTSNPVARSLMTFNNWSFAAFNNLTTPILQGTDNARAAMGIVTTMMLGMLQEPLRAWINGKEYEVQSTKKLAAIGLLNSGILGQFGNGINMLNTAFHGNLLPGILPEKYSGLSPISAIAGVPGSVVESLARIGEDVYTGKATKKTARDVARLVPVVNAIETRRLVNAIVDEIAKLMHLPDSKRGQHGWWLWERMNENKD